MLNCIFPHICRWRAKVLHWRWWLRLVPTWVSQRLATNINQLWGLGRSMVSPVDGQNQAVGINNILYYQCTESAQLCVCHINRTQRDILSGYPPAFYHNSSTEVRWVQSSLFQRWSTLKAIALRVGFLISATVWKLGKMQFFLNGRNGSDIIICVSVCFCCIYCISKIWTMCYHVGLAYIACEI